MNDVSEIEVPFDLRHACWFCGEPSSTKLSFPFDSLDRQACKHQPLILPSCGECKNLAQKRSADSIFTLRQAVKQSLITKYKAHLAIGLNWTKEELAQSEFEGGNFEGFKRSAWFMFEVAQQRVNYSGWPIILDGIELPDDGTANLFDFDGIEYPNIAVAISYYCQQYFINESFFKSVLYILGVEQFARAVRICRLQFEATRKERQQLLLDLAKEQHSEQ